MIHIEGTKDFVYLATVALAKNYTQEEFLNSHWMKNNEKYISSIWPIVEKARQKDRNWFTENYRGYKFYKDF